MIIRRYSCCSPIFGSGSVSFDANTYSAFKYGSFSALKVQAELMNKLIDAKLPELNSNDWVLSSAAFKKVPTASTLLTWHLDIFKNSFSPLPFVQLERNFVYPEDYAKLSKEERVIRLNKVTLHFPIHELIGKKLLLIDDAYVTGAHEENIIKQVGPFVDEIVFLYLIDLSHCLLPDMEAKINMNAVHSIDDLVGFIDEGNYQLNARTVKYILSQSDAETFRRFIYAMKPALVYKLYKASVADGYAKMKPFATNMRILSQAVIDYPTVLINNYGRNYAGISA